VAPLRSVYVRDPDGNLVEISNEVGTAAMGDKTLAMGDRR
jgi:hypothetical protein